VSEPTPAPGAPPATGPAPGYRAARTLPAWVELARQLRRRRTQIALGLVVVLPGLLWLAFDLSRPAPAQGSLSLVDLAKGGGPNFTVFALFAASGFLLVVLVALFFGDTVASEASWSSLGYLLAAPVPRVRLLRQKAIVAAGLSVLAILLLPAVSLLVGALAYGAKDLVTPTGESLSFGLAAARIALAAGYLALHLSWVAGLALLLSVSTDAPLGAVGGAVLISILSQILDTITALEGLRDYLPTHYANAWSDLLASEIDWSDMTRGVLSGLSYCAVFTALAAYHLTRKDITS
jgi:ABC-2 type transport system permease protein